jgi:hypothetical protein
MTMARPTERRRRGIQFASVVFVCTLIVVVVATGLYASSAPAPGAKSSSTDDRVFGSGPVSSFPASWDDYCGDLVSGNATTIGTNFGPDSPLGPNLTLSQVYSRIVSSSAFQGLAAGRSWVTLDWGSRQEGPLPSGFMQTFVSADFLFVSGGIPDPDGYAQMSYLVGSGNVTGFAGPAQSTCTGGVSFYYGARLSTITYAVGQPVGINFTFTNLTDASMTITASTSCLANFTILHGGPLGTSGLPPYGAEVYDSAEHPGCAGPPLKVVLNPSQTYAQTVEWYQTDDNGAQVPPGYYWITGMEAGYLGQAFPVSVIEGPLMIGNQTQG